jgi:hypothetical protein
MMHESRGDSSAVRSSDGVEGCDGVSSADALAITHSEKRGQGRGVDGIVLRSRDGRVNGPDSMGTRCIRTSCPTSLGRSTTVLKSPHSHAWISQLRFLHDERRMDLRALHAYQR